MNEKFLVDFLGVLGSSTLGCVFFHFFLRGCYGFLSAVWLVNFCFLWAALLFVPVINNDLLFRWGLVLCFGILFFSAWYFLMKRFLTIGLDNLGRNVFPLLIVFGGSLIVVKESWWFESLHAVDLIQSFVMIFCTASIMIFGGIFMFLYRRHS